MGKGGLLLAAQIVTQVLGFITGIWIASALTQIEYGAYRLLVTIVGYCRFTSLGIPQAVLFKLPVAVGRNNKEEMANIPSTLHASLVFTRSTLFLVAIFLAIYNVRLNTISLQWAWILIGVTFAISGWNSLFETMFRSHQQFGILGVLRIARPICSFLGLAVLLSRWKINGILIAGIIAGSVQLITGFKKHSKKLRWTPNIRKIWEFIRFGLPISLSSFVWLLITTSTIWVISSCSSPEQTGIFGFAMLIATAYKVLPGIAGEMAHPRMMAYYGKVKGDETALKKIMTQTSFAWAGVNVLPAALSLLAFDGLIQYFLPKYSGAWGAMLCVVLGYYCYDIMGTVGNFVIIRGQAMVLLIGNICVFFLQLGLAIAIAKNSTSLFVISIAPMIGLIVSGLFVLYIGFFDRNKLFCISNHIWKILFRMLLGIVTITAIWGMLRFYRGWYWFVVMLFLIPLICTTQTYWGYRHLRGFWRTTA